MGVGADSYSLGLPDSTFGYYSNFATFIAVLFCVILGLLANSRSGSLESILLILGLILSSYMILVCASRGAVVVTVILDFWQH
jgi:hypothetical protein